MRTENISPRALPRQNFALMVQGTASNVGKSVLVAALCRIFARRSLKVCPFKSQNMALNSFVDAQGKEMGRAQVTQALAAGLEPCVDMNPLLLKPSSDHVSQLIVKGEVRGSYSALEYHRMKPRLMYEVLDSYQRLAAHYEWMIVEGAGSPAEINLREGDLVNMGLAEELDLPVILVADIDKGGVFASLLGTLELISPSERRRVIACVINKFRGDLSLLQAGIEMFEKKSGLKVLGVIPYLQLELDDEDSLSLRLYDKPQVVQEVLAKEKETDTQLRLAIIRLSKLSNFSDFTALEYYRNLELRYCSSLSELKAYDPDIIVLPGTKASVAELEFLAKEGIDEYLKTLYSSGKALVGICGGMQLLGRKIYDPHQVESQRKEVDALGIMDFSTEFHQDKITRQRRVKSNYLGSYLLEGYEIHHGLSSLDQQARCRELYDHAPGLGYISEDERCLCTYLHGFFDHPRLFEAWVKKIFGVELLSDDQMNMSSRFEAQIERLADSVEQSLDLDYLEERVKDFYRQRSSFQYAASRTNLHDSGSYGSLMLASLSSGSGKTSLSLGLCRAFVTRGIKLKAYKTGPDYIDTAYLSLASGIPAGNLDFFLSHSDELQEAFRQDAHSYELQFVESAMGFYDGLGKEFYNSASDISAQLKIPVILCIPALAYSSTAAAVAYGLMHLRAGVSCLGFIVTQAKSKRHAQLIAEAITEHLGLRYFGAYYYRDELHIDSRHLGLAQLQHTLAFSELEARLEVFAQYVEEDLDLDGILEAVRSYKAQAEHDDSLKLERDTKLSASVPKLTLAYAYDEAFSFYYESSLRYLSKFFKLRPFSPLHDCCLPSCDAVYLGGGYPEVYASGLSDNISMREDIKAKVEYGLPLYAECGGYMYLSRELVDKEGKSYDMVGIFPGRSRMCSKRSERFGYLVACAQEDTQLTSKGQKFRAHEFHYASMEGDGELFECTKLSTQESYKSGRSYKSCLASYAHLDLSAHKDFVDSFFAAAQCYHRKRNEDLMIYK